MPESWVKSICGAVPPNLSSNYGIFSSLKFQTQNRVLCSCKLEFSARKIRVGDLVEIKLDRSNISGRHFGTVKSLMNSKLFCVECGAEAPGCWVSWEGSSQQVNARGPPSGYVCVGLCGFSKSA